MLIVCSHCGKTVDKPKGYVTRALKIGAPQFCDKKCFGLSHRVDRTLEEKKLLKRDYDKQYRDKKAEIIKAKKKTYDQSLAGRAMQKRNRDKFKNNHLEYCRTEKYRLGYKKNYDEKYHANKKYGEYFEAAIILHKIEEKIQPELYNIKYNNGLLNKSQNRKRKWNSMQKI